MRFFGNGNGRHTAPRQRLAAAVLQGARAALSRLPELAAPPRREPRALPPAPAPGVIVVRLDPADLGTIPVKRAGHPPWETAGIPAITPELMAELDAEAARVAWVRDQLPAAGPRPPREVTEQALRALQEAA